LDYPASVWNVIDGERLGIRIVAFDCRIGHGKGSWRRSVIAAETSADVFAPVPFNRDLTLEHSDGWVILYEPRALLAISRGLMPVAELEAHLDAVQP
jgi:hypothetical protein